ncbi:MAG: glycosyltransferase [Nitrososphaerota archaeon]|nr:glycosyltransferase [Nitrososphaerota archaeon]
MRVLFVTGTSDFQVAGGGEVAVLKKKDYLSRIGVEVELFNPVADKIRDFDLVHLYQFRLSNLEIARFTRRLGIPIILQPVYWPTDELLNEYPNARLSRLIQRALRLGRRSRLYFRIAEPLPFDPAAMLMSYSRVITTNSRLEEEVLRAEFPTSAQFEVIPAGVDARFADARPDVFRNQYNLEEFVLTVANICARKNTLRLINACKRLGIPLVVVGKPIEHAYYDRCLREAQGGKVLFLTDIEHDSPLLLSCYAAASVFALPSWLETPGLAALEAAVAGCKLVLTNRGSTTEYFSDKAIYVNPGSVESIMNGLKEARSAPRNLALKASILTRCRWEAVAESLRAVYESVLE